MSERMFPVLLSGYPRHLQDKSPRRVPWSFVAPHEAQALDNHSQSLEKLASRGGLCPCELWCVVHGKPWSAAVTTDEAVAWLQQQAEKWEPAHAD